MRLRWYEGNASPHGRKKLASYATDTRTSKMWILPDGRAAALSVWHFQWLLMNPEVAKRFGVPLDRLPQEETPIRIAALRAGFARLNYEHKNGTLTVEVSADEFSSAVKDSLVAVVLQNRKDVYIIRVNLIRLHGNKIKSVRSSSANLFTYDNNAKVGHIPFVTEPAPVSSSPKGRETKSPNRGRRKTHCLAG